MPFLSCYIPSCGNTKYDVKLFNFPRNESLRMEWVKRIASHYPQVLELSSKQLVKRLICIRHFEPKFLLDGKRLYNGCPTLITQEEIDSGTPTMPMDIDPETDHTYFKSPMKSDHSYYKRHVSDTIYQRGKISERIPVDFGSTGQAPAVPSTSKEIVEVQPEVMKNVAVTPVKKSTSTKSTVITCKGRMRLTQSIATLTPKCRKLYDKCLSIIKRRKLFGGDNKQNIEDAKKLCDTKNFQKLVDSLEDTPKKFFLMHLRNAVLKKKARRYTIEEKLLCLAILKQSRKGYQLLERIFALPSKRTLNRVLRDVHIEQGINVKFFQSLKEKVKCWKPPINKLCSIVFDEVQLSPGITYVPSTDTIYGFVSGNDKPKFADHALVFMLRGICASWRQPIAYYFCEGTMPTAALIRIIKEIVHAVLDTGLEPLAFICDQGLTNQSALRALQEQTRAEQLRNGLACDDTISIEGYQNVYYYHSSTSRWENNKYYAQQHS